MLSPYADRLSDIPVTRESVTVAGAQTSYWVYGEDDAPTIVAIHGFRGEHHGLEPVVAYLPEYRVIMPDLPGFGETPPMPDRRHNLEAYVDWLNEFVAAVAPGSVILGHSFGSIVTSAAVAGGLKTPRLILVNPIGAPALAGPRGIMTRLAVFYYWVGARLPKSLGDWLLRSPLVVKIMTITMAKTKDKALRRFIHNQHDTYFSRFADRDVLHDAFVTSVSHDVSQVAARLMVPTLLIAAEKDDITPIEKERILAERIAHSTLVEIKNVGHLIHYETPKQAALAIQDFLAPL